MNGLKDELYRKMQSGLEQFPEDELVIVAIKSVKEEWLKDIEIEKRKLEAELKKDDANVEDANLDDYQERKSEERFDPNEFDNEVMFEENEDEKGDKRSEDMFDENNDENEQRNKEPALEKDLGNKKSELKGEGFISTPLTESQMSHISRWSSQQIEKKRKLKVLIEEKEESESQTFTQIIEDPLICERLEKESIEIIRSKKKKTRLNVLANEVCEIGKMKNIEGPSFSLGEEFENIFSKIPFLDDQPEMAILRSLSTQEMMNMCYQRAIQNGDSKEIGNQVNEPEPVTPAGKVSWTTVNDENNDSKGKEIQVYSHVVFPIETIMKKMQLPKKQSDEIGKGKREKKPSQLKKSPWHKRIVDIKTDLPCRELKLSDTIFMAIDGEK